MQLRLEARSIYNGPGVRERCSYISATMSSGTWSAVARMRVKGAITIRCCSESEPTVTGLKSVDCSAAMVSLVVGQRVQSQG
jgi:hypothetical protein